MKPLHRKIRIGLVKALLYFKHQKLWETFFNELNCEVIVSNDTNKKILKEGIKHSIDESCLSAKIFMGHINDLKDRVDFILVPRIASYGKNDITCTKFHAMYDIVRNTFKDVKIIDYNLDLEQGQSELRGFIKMGSMITKNPIRIIKAYIKARNIQAQYDKERDEEQERLVAVQNKLKILIASHPYNTYDKLIGMPIINYLKKLDVIPVFSDAADKEKTIKASSNISNTIYWCYNKEIIGAIEYYRNKIDGILFLTTFPCGPDSLVTELCMRKIKGIPVANIVIDELQGEAGLHTRIESFIDIIQDKKQRNRELKNAT